MFADVVHMRLQRACRHGPQAGWYVVVGFFNPFLQAALGQGLHGGGDFGLALEAVGFEMRDGWCAKPSTWPCAGKMNSIAPVFAGSANLSSESK